LFVYWNANNTLSIIQALAVKHPRVKAALNLPKTPTPEEAPEFRLRNPFNNIMKVLVHHRSQALSHNAFDVDHLDDGERPRSTTARCKRDYCRQRDAPSASLRSCADVCQWSCTDNGIFPPP